MKRRTAIAGIVLACLIPVAAWANSWGLRGELLSAVSAVNTWNDYAVWGKQAGNAAVMRSRYHAALMRVEDGELGVYSTAVYQPEDELADTVSLEADGDALVLTYGEGQQRERYEFGSCEYGYCLTRAQIGDFRVELVNESGWYRFLASDAQREAYLGFVPYLRKFHIDLFPRSVEEVRHLNAMLAVLDSGSVVMTEEEGLHCQNVGTGTAPVYSAPFGEAAWRAGNGKAAVGLRGEFWQIGSYIGADGEEYVRIRYDVSERTQRIGYVRAQDIGEQVSEETTDDPICVDVVARSDTYLTDDPDVSEYRQLEVPAGTQLTCMAIYKDVYAYVAGEVREDRFVDGGAAVWGFVPLRDLDVDPNGNYPAELCEDVMARLEGAWEFYAGGNQAQDVLVFDGHGNFQGTYWLSEDGARSDVTGTYKVTPYHTTCNLYWNDPPYVLTLTGDDGSVNVKGLSFSEDQGEEIFSLTYWEGGGGYRRIDAQDDGNG